MKEKFKNKYRIQSNRAEWWDYGSIGAYFITICTHNRESYFGNILNNEVTLSSQGIITEQYWYEIPERFSFATLGNFIAMPNHIHGIIIIHESEEISSSQTENTEKMGGFANDKNPMIHENLSRVIRWYKGRCSFEIRKNCDDFSWQSNFHERIIRNENEYLKITQYIETNPMTWENDKLFESPCSKTS